MYGETCTSVYDDSQQSRSRVCGSRPIVSSLEDIAWYNTTQCSKVCSLTLTALNASLTSSPSLLRAAFGSIVEIVSLTVQDNTYLQTLDFLVALRRISSSAIITGNGFLVSLGTVKSAVSQPASLAALCGCAMRPAQRLQCRTPVPPG